MSLSASGRVYDVVVVGAGAAGVGVSVALGHAGIEDIVILEREAVGASFSRWPAETRFITPSFPTNSVGMPRVSTISSIASSRLATISAVTRLTPSSSLP